MNWFSQRSLGGDARDWLTFGVLILFSFVLCITSLRIVLWRLTRDGKQDESEKEYWREHGE